LQEYNCIVDVYDLWVDSANAIKEIGLGLIDSLSPVAHQGVILAVNHINFRDLGAHTIRKSESDNHVFYKLKYIVLPNEIDLRFQE
jgi:UDP-N-acetyl-D-galactosamine dehydrogenase